MRDIQLMTLSKIRENLYEVVPEPPADPGHLEGKEVLAQEVVKRILTLQGSNAINPDLGSLFPRVIAETSDLQINIAFSMLQDQIRLDQEDIEIPDEEKLDRIILDDLNVQPDLGLVEVLIRVVNVLGDWVGFVIRSPGDV